MATIAEPLQQPDIEHENPTRVVWALAWPAVALNSLQVINTLLDRGFIGHLPQAALTAHGGATNVLFLMFSLAIALATGATAIVSRAFGAGDQEEFRRASREAVSLSIVFGLIICGVTLLIGPFVARAVLPENDHEAIRLMSAFTATYALCLPAIYVIQTLAGSLRGIGDTKSPMVISGIQILLHILLNFYFIFPTREIAGVTVPGLGWGLVGAGASLTISAWVSAIMYLGYTHRTPLGNLARLYLPHREWAVRILRIAVPAASMAVLRVLSLTAFTLVLKHVPNGSVAIAAMTVGFAIESIMFMPPFGLSAAAGALVGQSLGMRRPDRAERLAWIAAHHGALVTFVVSIPIFIYAPNIAHVMLGGKKEIIAEATSFLRYLCLTEIFFAYAMVTIGGMQGAGDTVRPMWISIISLWLVRVPAAYILALPLGMGATGAWIAMSVTQGIQGVISMWAFKQGAWKQQKV